MVQPKSLIIILNLRVDLIVKVSLLLNIIIVWRIHHETHVNKFCISIIGYFLILSFDCFRLIELLLGLGCLYILGNISRILLALLLLLWFSIPHLLSITSTEKLL